jgi:small subunit ribosomal protein S10e
MFIRKRERKLILTYLFTEGVMTSNKFYTTDFVVTPADEHNPVAITVPNWQVIKLLQSLTDKGYVRSTFNWSHYYWFLTEEGIEYLREFLHLPADVKPRTEMKSAAVPNPLLGGEPRYGDRDGRGGDRGDRRGGGDRRPPREGGYERREGGDRRPPREGGAREGGGFGRARNSDEGGYRRAPAQ